MPTPPTDPDRADGPTRGAIASLILAVGLFLGGLVGFPLWLSTQESPGDDRDASAATRDLVGAEACIDCHPGEHAHFARSGHARTLRPAADRLLARALDGRTVDDPERPGVSWSYHLRDGVLGVDRREGGAVRDRLVLEYAFGSGHHATTFLTLTDRDPGRPRALEHRLTHFTLDDRLGVTPGQKADAGLARDGPLGFELPPDETLKCFGCHATATSAGGRSRLDPETMVPNVSCERCHGPGREHVEAARRGEADLSMPFGPGNRSAEQQLALCGECHRHPSNAAPGVIRPDNPQIARFQPVGVMQSRCYTEGGGTFSCVTCHDPHARARSDHSFYEAICLDCHGPGPDPSAGAPRPSGCVACHMPGIDSGQDVIFTDHWIRPRDEPGLRGPCSRPMVESTAE